jgi:hypothetical protein
MDRKRRSAAKQLTDFVSTIQDMDEEEKKKRARPARQSGGAGGDAGAAAAAGSEDGAEGNAEDGGVGLAPLPKLSAMGYSDFAGAFAYENELAQQEAASLQAGSDLTPEQFARLPVAEQKRQKRLIRNRLSAHVHRLRQRAHFDALETQVTELSCVVREFISRASAAVQAAPSLADAFPPTMLSYVAPTFPGILGYTGVVGKRVDSIQRCVAQGLVGGSSSSSSAVGAAASSAAAAAAPRRSAAAASASAAKNTSLPLRGSAEGGGSGQKGRVKGGTFNSAARGGGGGGRGGAQAGIFWMLRRMRVWRGGGGRRRKRRTMEGAWAMEVRV